MVVPALGTLTIRNEVAGIKFQENLKNETRNIVRKTLSEKVFRRTNYLNSEKLSLL
jgi:hypothetical protein